MFQTQTIISNISTMVDGGLSIKLHTRELPPNDMTKIFELKGKEIWICFKKLEIVESDIKIPDEPVMPTKHKSLSQQLRNAMYVFWNEHRPTKDFEEFRKYKMEEIINYILKQV